MSKLEEQFVSYDIALKLKEIGFNEGCLAYYVNQNFRLKIYLNKNCNLNSDFTIGNLFATPLYQQVFDYFEKEHLLFSSIRIGFGDSIWYDYMIQSIDNRTIQKTERTYYSRSLEKHVEFLEESSIYVEENESFDTKKEAQIACINKLIELVKNESKS